MIPKSISRISSYTILSNQLEHGGYALLNGLTGAIELINDELYEFLYQKINSLDPSQLLLEEHELPKELYQTLFERGHIVSVSVEEERAQMLELCNIFHEEELRKASFVIVPDMDCNYRCTYCYERSLQNSLSKIKHRCLTLEQIPVLFQVMDNINASHKQKHPVKKITLYGGEPLNKKNYEVVKALVQEGVLRGYQFSAITNGHDLNHYIDLCGSSRIHHLQISIDGPKPIHDQRRIPIDGSSSFEKIVQNIRLVLKNTSTTITIRIHIDSSNLSSLSTLISLFNSEGWTNSDRIRINIALVHEKNDKGTVSYRNTLKELRESLQSYCELYSNFFIGCAESNFESEIFHSLVMNDYFHLRSSYCGASSNMYILQPTGQIHTCWETIGQDLGQIGTYNLDGTYSLDSSCANNWFQRSPAKLQKCPDCPYCLICAGGCPYVSLCNSGSLYQPNCDDFQESFPALFAHSVEQYLRMYNL